MVVLVRNAVTVLLLYVLSRNNTEALQTIGNGGGKGSTDPPGASPPPLSQRVNVGTLSVSPMGLGTLNLPLNKEADDEATSVLKTASDCGINFVDTAEAVS